MAGFRRGPSLTVDALWVDRGRVLLVRRGRPPFQGRWALPGGFVEPTETVEEALQRELKEETGLTGRAGPIVGVFSGPDRDPRRPTATVVFLVRGRAGPPTGGSDAAEAAWVPLTRARSLAFDHDTILRRGLRLLRGDRATARRRR